MASAVNRRGYFQWDIINPFQPRRELEARFFYFSYEAKPIKVVLEPMGRNMNRWEFSLTLSPSSRWNWGVEMPENVVIFIRRGNNLVKRKKVPDSHFCWDTRWTYRYQGEVEMIPEPQKQHFQIKIEFDFMYREKLNPYFFNDDDLRHLADGMWRLLSNEGDNMNPNMSLFSANNEDEFRVHSYILYWRWNNLLRDNEDRRDVHTNISSRILSHILRYMYCARFHTFRSTRSLTELCQVIDWYEIGHLYNVLVQYQSQQRRVTSNGAYTGSHLFPLEISESRNITNPSFVWKFDGRESEDGEYSVTFRMQVGNEAGNWLSYSLQSRSTGHIFVEVNLEVVKRLEGEPETVIRFVGQDYTVEPNQTVESGPVGRPETFDGTEGNNFIRCFLRVSAGKKAEIIQSVYTDQYQDEDERYCLLSEHMCKVNRPRMFSQLIYSRVLAGEARCTQSLHHEMLRARVPQGWRGFRNASPDHIPYFATCTLSSQALPIVLDYIYTGKLKPFGRLGLEEIDDFAALTDFRALSDWLRRYINWLNERFS